ncbi:MAG: HD domain-containing protein [Deltaproteobacteria bacterium]|nr:HD domain-containing protein [Deltaproteobacteria bacterium]
MAAKNLLENLTAGAARLAGHPGLQVLLALAHDRRVQVYLVGGTVRDLALGRASPDLDLAVPAHTLELARELARVLGGAFVLLDEGERTARVVAGEQILDLTEFRAPTLTGDLQGRDFTINALALDLAEVVAGAPLTVHDPTGALQDLAAGVIRMVAPENLAQDPLRLLRAYRFAATLGFAVTPETTAAVRRFAGEFPRVAGERVHHELFLLLAAPGAASVLAAMDEAGLLCRVFPELPDLKGVEQKGFHHLDVFHHSLETVQQLEAVLAEPGRFFPDSAAEIAAYAAAPPRPALLKLAALYHDAGKPLVREERPHPERYTFYQHERVGGEIFAGLAQRLRLSQAEAKVVGRLIAWHMRPFLLLPLFRRGELTVRALGRLVKAAGADLAGGFALAMADSLAGQGPLKPPDSETALADLAAQAFRFRAERLDPLAQAPRLLTGHDLTRVFGLTPGPRFKELLTAVEEAQWEGRVTRREEALDLVRRLLETT